MYKSTVYSRFMYFRKLIYSILKQNRNKFRKEENSVDILGLKFLKRGTDILVLFF